MATFVLVHGGYMGGWCWRGVADRLIAEGHTVYTPTLTGQGERAHLLTREIAMETHVADVTNVLTYEDLRDVILVGHSYGTWVMTQVADRVYERVRHLVCLDGQLFRDGEGGMTPRTEEAREQLRGVARKYGDGWRLPPPPRKNPLWSDFTDEQWTATSPRLTPMALGWFEAACHITRLYDVRPPGTMLRFTRSPFGSGGPSGPLARAQELGWTRGFIDAGHYGMITQPDRVALALRETAARA
jgi:pimeloyl-ACP methyl ester carboxylesterase